MSLKIIPKQIRSFSGKYRFLSNFWPAQVELDGMIFPTVEHAYQAAKLLDPAERRFVANIKTPGEVKRLSKTWILPSDWRNRKLGIMFSLVQNKFERDKELRKRLIQTGDAYLIEGNSWGDKYWGAIHSGEGENWLGRILMIVRSQLTY